MPAQNTVMLVPLLELDDELADDEALDELDVDELDEDEPDEDEEEDDVVVELLLWPEPPSPPDPAAPLLELLANNDSASVTHPATNPTRPNAPKDIHTESFMMTSSSPAKPTARCAHSSAFPTC